VLHETPVSALVRTDAQRVGRGEPLAKLVTRVLEGGAMHQHVVDEEGKLLGSVSLQEVGPLLREDGVEGLLLAYDVMRQPPVAVTRSDSLSTCLERFGRVDADELPVVDGAGKLIGRVTRADVLSFYAREVIGDKSRGMKFITRTDRSTAEPAAPGEGETPSEVVTDFVEVPPDHTVEALSVPPGFVGRTLKELSIRTRFGVAVISMRRRTPGGGRISLVAPDPDLPLREGDVLVLAGPKEQVEKLRKLVGQNAT
jgi:CBS domain-containing protein